ncbi:MAG: CdaR family protein [Desulfofundulus sp.]
MDNWLQKDAVVRVVALLLAFVMWLFVVNEQNPQDTRTILVTPELRNVPTGLVLMSEVKPVTVKLKGRRSELYATGGPELGAYVDLTSAQEGEKPYPVRLTSVPPEVQLVQIVPPEVTVRLESIVQQQLPVELVLRGTPAPGYAAGPPVLSPVQVLVEGPRSRVKMASRAVVRLDTEGAKDNIRVSVPVQILDSKGAPVPEGLRIKPEVVDVSLPVARLPAKLVPVKPQITGEPAEGYKVSQVLVEPATIIISGPAAMLAEISSVSTMPLDVSGASINQSGDLRVVLPQDVRAEVERVRVTAVIEPRTVQRTVEGVEVKVHDLGDKLTASVQPNTVRVTVAGLYQNVNWLTAGDLTAYVSARELASGEYELEVELVLPEAVKRVSVEPPKVKLVVKPAETSPEEKKTEGKS